VSGIERGVTGLGIRGVVPVRKGVKIVGAIEIGHSLSGQFLRKHSQRWGIQITLYEKATSGSYVPLGGVERNGSHFLPDHDLAKVETGGLSIVIAPRKYPGLSFLLGPIKDYTGKVVALVEITVDRHEIEKRLSNTRFMMIVVALGAIAISFLMTYLVTFFFIRPIKEIVRKAQDIAAEKRETRLKLKSQDEIGTLTKALNTMLDSLRERRKEIEEHANTLERRVRERTYELVESEEKYRTLVENIPLIVYRILRDGTTEFINSALTESLGYGIEEAVGNRRFWREKICNEETDPKKDVFKVCFEEGRECRTERRVKDKGGRQLIFIDHAIPAWNLSGSIKWVDGIMMDITEIKSLQDRILRSEEIRLLGEISARMAHEIRNPLSAAGGFARRLHLALSDNDPNKKSAQIIVEQVAKLENLLKILLSSISPFDLSLEEVDVGQILSSLLKTLKGLLKSKKIEVVSDIPPGIPAIQGDRERLNQALENLLKHAILSTPEGEKFYLAVERTGDRLEVILRHKMAKLSEDDLEKFFFPHVEDWTDTKILDLPLSKVIIHRHRGKVDVTRESGNILVMKIELPMGLTE
jgi:PAS domain S-box-containing protein